MKKQSKSLLIAIAAFAVTTTGVSAHTGARVLNKAGLNDDQISAIETARELRKEGDLTKARDMLLEAGISENILKKIGQAAKQNKVEKLDKGSLDDLTEEQINAFEAAKVANDKETMKSILEEAGFDHSVR